MTKEEIQQGYHDQCKVDINAPEHLQIPAYYTHDGWMQGAEWMQEQMIDKACDWLEENAINYVGKDGITDWRSVFADFRKHMKEE